MKTDHLTLYSPPLRQFTGNEFEEALYHSMLQYSLQHLPIAEDILQEKTMEALQKSIQICSLADVNSKHHFKQMYIFDSNTGAMRIDWRMSKKGLNLMITQIPTLNEKTAQRLWELATGEVQ
jgi:hypothetical protein